MNTRTLLRGITLGMLLLAASATATAGTLITSDSGAVTAARTLSVSLTDPVIAYVLAFGASSQDPVHLDNLRYESATVPEPFSVALFAAGLVRMACAHSRPEDTDSRRG